MASLLSCEFNMDTACVELKFPFVEKKRSIENLFLDIYYDVPHILKI